MANKKMGRPTTFNPEYVEGAIEYATTGYREWDEAVPTIVGYALHIGQTERQIYKWAEKHDNFRQALDMIKARQQAILISEGLRGNFNATITKLVLSANHGMHERQETEISGELGVFEIDYTGAKKPDTEEA